MSSGNSDQITNSSRTDSAVSSHAQSRPVEHCLCEVGGEILSKPNALSDLLESMGFPKTIVYCNSPSDTDLLEVLLRKRGISASKLIGYVSPSKASWAMERLDKNEISTLVVTDIAARALDLSVFDVAVNYSIHNDPDIYLQRACMLPQTDGTELQGGASEVSQGAAKATALKVISLVAPLDIAGFHSVRKAVDSEFVTIEPPSKDSLLKARIDNLGSKVLAHPQSDESYAKMAKLLLGHAQCELIIEHLLRTGLETVPQLTADLEKAQAERMEYEEDQDSRESQGNWGGRSGDRGEGRGDRDSRSDRDGRRGGDRRSGRRGGRYDDNGSSGRMGGRGRSSDTDSSDRDRGDDSGYSRPDSRSRGGEGRGRGHRHSEEGGWDSGPAREMLRIKEDRIYIGRGSAEGFSQDDFKQLLSSVCGAEQDVLKRFSLREHYSFADLPAEVSEGFLEKLQDCKLEDGSTLFVTKAASLSFNQPAPRQDEGEDVDRGYSSGEEIEAGESDEGGTENVYNPDDDEMQDDQR